MNKKQETLSLDDLRVKSFVTAVDRKKAFGRGGTYTLEGGCDTEVGCGTGDPDPQPLSCSACFQT